MSFLSNHKLLELLSDPESEAGYINPFDKDRIESGAYELSMGNEYYTTNTETATKTILSEREQFVIEPGQFALLLTKETIKIPRRNLGFISIKAGIKFKGLINVSGFHVDPGFEGKLKFSVYNAGSKPIVLEEGQRMFPLWLSELTDELSVKEDYDGSHQKQSSISSDDVSRMAGVVVSPSVLKENQAELGRRFVTLETNIANSKAYLVTFVGVVITLLGLIISKYTFADPNRALQKEFDDNQKAMTARLNKQDSILNVQKMIITRQDSLMKRLISDKPTVQKSSK